MSESDLNDKQLMEEVCRRNPRAWRVLVRRHEDRLRDVVSEIAEVEQPLTDDQIDDVLGDTWLLLLEDDLRRLRSFRGDDLGAWLAMVASQVALTRVRELAREPETESFDEALHSPIRTKAITNEGSSNGKAPYLTVLEAARALRVSPKTVYRLVWRGEIAARRIGRGLRIARTAISDGDGQKGRAGIGPTSVIRSGRRSRSGIGGR
jgi:excisionase family DNA binding protein